MTQEQVESQLSAMFDGELPAAECELLSRRLDRDENLRARWSRYALIGAAMRSEPVATARHGFAGRVSAALQAGDGSSRRQIQVQVRAGARKRSVWNAALAASMVAAVAGVSISMLHYSSPYIAAVPAHQNAINQNAVNTGAASSLATGLPVAAAAAVMPVAMRVTAGKSAAEPRGYTTPVNQSSADMGLRTQLADFIVAHSEYSTPLMRGSLLSALVSSEEGGDSYAAHPHAAVGAGPIDASAAASPASH